MTLFLAGAVLGLAGGGHCALMCGPLLVLFRVRTRGGGTNAWLYHAGRVTMYVVIGLGAGMAGAVLVNAAVGRWLAVVAGASLVAYGGLSGLNGSRRGAGALANVSRSLERWLAAAARWMAVHRVSGPFGAGLLNGLLPCGLVYAAALAALGAGSPGLGAVLMCGFGLGTLPVLVTVGASASLLTSRLAGPLRRAVPVACALVGVLLIARGVMSPHHAAPSSAVPQATHAHGS